MKRKGLLCLLAMVAVCVSSCGETKVDENKKATTVKEEQAKDFSKCNLKLSDRELKIDSETEMYIDSGCYGDMLESYTYKVGIDDEQKPTYSLVRQVNENGGMSQVEIKSPKDFELMELNTEGTIQKAKYLTDVYTNLQGDVYGLWQEFQVDSNDPTGKKLYLNRGVIKIARDTNEVTQMADNLYVDETKELETSDFMVNENEEFLLYYPEEKRFELFSGEGKLIQDYDVTEKLSGKVQFQGGFIWALDPNDKSLLKIDASNLEEEKKIDLKIQNDSWFVMGNEETGFAVVDFEKCSLLQEDEVSDIKLNSMWENDKTLQQRDIVMSSNQMCGFVLERESDLDYEWKKVYEVKMD